MKKALIFFTMIITFTILVSCSIFLLDTEEESYLVEYRVTDGGSSTLTADIRYDDEDGNTIRVSDETLPFSYEFEVEKPEDGETLSLSLSAVNSDSLVVSTDSVTVLIIVDDEVVDSDTALRDSRASASSTLR